MFFELRMAWMVQNSALPDGGVRVLLGTFVGWNMEVDAPEALLGMPFSPLAAWKPRAGEMLGVPFEPSPAWEVRENE
jgi:hypothetical protein